MIVGHQAGRAPATVAAAWYAPGLTGWRRAAVAGPGASTAQATRSMNAVTATARGFVAVGAAGTRPAAWLSADRPDLAAGQRSRARGRGARGARLRGGERQRSVAAVGTEFTAAGASSPFAEVSADAGATWTHGPASRAGHRPPGTGTTVTALTAAGGGFTATGTYGPPGGPEVVVWTLPPGTPVTGGTALDGGDPAGHRPGRRHRHAARSPRSPPTAPP